MDRACTRSKPITTTRAFSNRFSNPTINHITHQRHIVTAAAKKCRIGPCSEQQNHERKQTIGGKRRTEAARPRSILICFSVPTAIACFKRASSSQIPVSSSSRSAIFYLVCPKNFLKTCIITSCRLKHVSLRSALHMLFITVLPPIHFSSTELEQLPYHGRRRIGVPTHCPSSCSVPNMVSRDMSSTNSLISPQPRILPWNRHLRRRKRRSHRRPALR